MDSWSNLAFVGACTMVSLAVLVRYGRLAVLGLYVALLPATNLYVDVGMSISAARVVEAVLAASALGLLAKGKLTRAQLWVVHLLAYGLGMTLLGNLMAPRTPIDADDFRTAFRPVVQWVAVGSQILPVFLVPVIARSADDIRSVCRAVLCGALVLALGAIAQWGTYAIFDVNLFPIYREGIFGERRDIGQFVLFDTTVFRANSFAREPKDLATFLVIVGFATALLLQAGTISRARAIIAFFAVAMVATILSFSTTTVVLGAVSGLVLVAAMMYKRRPGRTRTLLGGPEAIRRLDGVSSRRARSVRAGLAAAMCGVACLAGILWAVAGPELGSLLSAIWDARVVERLGAIEEYDSMALAFIGAEPRWALLGTGAGNLPRYAYPYLPDDPVLLAYMLNLTWDPKSGLLKAITSYGLVGTAMLAVIVILVIRGLLRSARRRSSLESRWNLGFTWVVILVSVLHALRAVDDVFWLTLGLGVALTRATAQTRLPSVAVGTGGRPPLPSSPALPGAVVHGAPV